LSTWGSSAAATSSSAPTIQIAIRPPQTDVAAGQPAATVTSVGSTPLQLRMQPERMILAAVTSADGTCLQPLCRNECAVTFDYKVSNKYHPASTINEVKHLLELNTITTCSH